MAEKDLEYFEDAFGNRVVPGDEVIYVLGDKSSKRLLKGVVDRIGENPERIYAPIRYYISCIYDPYRFGNKQGSISPLEVTDRIVKI